jgi:hypothetical protein
MRTESARRRTVNDGSLSALGLADEEIHQVASDKNVEIDGDLHNMRAWSVRSTGGGEQHKGEKITSSRRRMSQGAWDQRDSINKLASCASDVHNPLLTIRPMTS